MFELTNCVDFESLNERMQISMVDADVLDNIL